MSFVKNLLLLTIYGIFKNWKMCRIRYLTYLRSFDKRYNIRINVSDISITMFKGLILDGVDIRIKSLNIKIDSCIIGFSVPRMFKLGPKRSLSFKMNQLSIERKEKIKYLNKIVSDRNNSAANWDRLLFSYLNNLTHYLFKHQIELSIFNLKTHLLGHSWNLKEIRLSNEQLSFDVIEAVGSQSNLVYHGQGSIDLSSRKIILKIYKVKLPSIAFGFNFDELELIVNLTHSNAQIQSEIEVQLLNVQVLHRLISPSKLKMKSIYLHFLLKATSENIALDEESGGSIEDIPFAFNLLHESKENNLLNLSFYIELTQDSLSSFLTFHNTELKSVKMDGKIILDFRMILNITNPYESYFSLSTPENSISITDLGNFDTSILNSNLTEMSKSTLIGRKINSRNLTSEVLLDEMADIFLDVILFTEDSSFYQHNGVNTDSIGYAILSNLSNKTFSRGGSTITMQLTRNLFLDSNKNIVRKVEEILISLIIENYSNIPKARILEIYCNIIEFGNGIYGIKQASNYYFGKIPKQLSLTEAITLSYIVPRPKHFHEALLIKTPQLLLNLPRYFKRTSKMLLNNGIITDDMFNNLDHKVYFANELGNIILKSDNHYNTLD